MDGSRRTIGLVLLGLLAFGLRAWVVFALSTEHTRPLDYEHGRLPKTFWPARDSASSFSASKGRPRNRPPSILCCWPRFIKALGVHSPAAILGVELLQCVAGAGAGPGGGLAGLVAAARSARHRLDRRVHGGDSPQPSLHGHPSSSGDWAALALTLLLAIVASPRWQATWPGAVLAGLVAGALLLVEPILCLALPLAAVFWLAGCVRAAIAERRWTVDGGRWTERG